MHEWTLAELRGLRRIHSGFLHQVVRHRIAGLLDFTLHCLKLKLSAVLQEFFEHFLRDWFAARFAAYFVLLHAKLFKELDEFGLKIAAELDLIGGFVVLLTFRAHLHLHALRYLLEQRLHLVRVYVVLFHVIGHVQVFPVLRVGFLVGDLGYDGVDAESSLGGVFDGRFRVQHLPNYAANLARLLLVLLGRGQAFVLLEAQPDKELDHSLTHGQVHDVRAARY